MNDDRSLERAARSWIEAGPTQAPERAVAAALQRIETTAQERDFRIPWRPTSMLHRVVFATLSAAVALGALTLGASLITTPDNAAGPCPQAFDEADAIDTFVAGLSPAQRAWDVVGRVPDGVGHGRIAAFTYNEGSDERTLVTIDPETKERCLLIRHVSGLVQSPGGTQLDWSPSGDALAIGMPGGDVPEGQGPGQLLIWTADRLLRVWTGEGVPDLEWSPDGRSLAVWSGASNVVTIQADGSADRTFDIRPVGPGPNLDSGLSWSPDGSRWLITQPATAGPPGPTAVSIVDVVDGRMTPIELGIDWLGAVDWIDDRRMLLREWEAGTGSNRYLDVPVAAPERFAVVPVPDDVLGGSIVAFSPDHTRAAFVLRDAGPILIVDFSNDAAGTPVVVDPGVGNAHDAVFWSPDGTQVLFHSNETVEGQPALFGMWIVNADGSGLREISRGNVIAVDDPWQPLAVQRP